MIGVGVIGTGFGRTVHIPAFLAARGARVVGVASSRYERARAVAAELSVPRCFPLWQEMLACPEIQAVSIATPPALHAEMTLAACGAGKAVLCEKPMALDAAQASEMLQAARAAAIVHFVGFEFREIPALRFARELLRATELGRLRHVNVTWIVHGWGDPSRQWSWRSDRSQGGGTLGALGVHVFDYLEWLLGPVRALAARTATRIPHRPDPRGEMHPVTSEDCCDVLLELCDGTPVSLAISNVAPVGKGHWIELYGEKRSLTIGSDNLVDYGKGFRVWEGVPGTPQAREVPVPPGLQFDREFSDGRIAPFARLTQRFVDAIRQHDLHARPSFLDGHRAQVLLDAVRQAHSARCWVEVPGGPGERNGEP